MSGSTITEGVDVASNMETHRSISHSPVNFAAAATVAKSESSSGYVSSNASSSPNSPPSRSPPHTLKRSKSSSFRLINRRISTLSNCSQISLPQESPDRLTTMIGWYPAFLLKIYFELLILFTMVFLKHVPLMIPTLWVSACLWVFWKSITFPFFIARSILIVLFLPSAWGKRRRRTVLISGGSTVQSVYLARNFYSAGARVIVCDVAGKFQLTRFSTSVSKYYTLPQVDDHQIDEYIDAIKTIVAREDCEYFIPVSESNTAYYDSLVKTHLELVGCTCICPDVDDVLLLDDVSEMLHQADRVGLSTPTYYDVANYAQLNQLYELGPLKQEAHTMISCGVTGCKNRVTYDLPSSRRDYRLTRPIGDMNPWLVLPKFAGERYVTCTTVRDSHVICNVTCRIANLDELVPVEKPDIERWLTRFFASLRPHRRIVGHMSFYFAKHPETGELVPVDCQVGVRMPYICYTSVQSRIVCKPCRHFSRNKSGPIVNNDGKYWLNRILIEALTHLSPVGIWNLLGIVYGRRDALFVLWDPLPYCAYYYLQLPINKFVEMVKKRSSDGS